MKRWAVRIAATLAGLIGAWLALALVAGALYQPAREIPTDLGGQLLEVAGLGLRVLQQGQGRDVLFIHGSPGSLEDFAQLRQALGEGFRFTQYDRPGHGFSSPSQRYDTAYNAEIAAALIEKLGLTRALVVGHSYGGSTALALALRKPARVSAYVVIDSASYRRIRVDPPLFRLLALPLLGAGIARLNPQSALERRIDEGLARTFAPREPPPGFVALRRRLWTQPKVAHTLAQESVHYDESLAQQAPRYPSIRAPVYILAQRDDAERRAQAGRLQREIPGAALTLVERTGHYIQIERTDAVAEVVRRAASEH